MAVRILPIKFRCNYCRQFLGISRAQAGGVVDCPTCGRSIRVPLLDGTVQPMLVPELNREDSHLSRALDELARLVDAPIPTLVPSTTARSELDENEAENQIPQPLPEPIPIEVPLLPTPVIVRPPVDATLGTPNESSVANERSLLAELASLSNGASVDEPGENLAFPEPRAKGRRTNSTTRSIPTYVFLIFGVFLAGMLTERFLRVIESLSVKQAPAVAEQLVPNTENGLTGRITFRSKEGDSQPDRGARVIVFPNRRTGNNKLSVAGFRPSDGPSDQQAASEAIKAVGGAVATVDERGSFRIPVEAGSYRMLILSHFQPRDASDSDPVLDKLLSEYFENPGELLGKVQHEFSALRIKGTGDIRDHSF